MRSREMESARVGDMARKDEGGVGRDEGKVGEVGERGEEWRGDWARNARGLCGPVVAMREVKREERFEESVWSRLPRTTEKSLV